MHADGSDPCDGARTRHAVATIERALGSLEDEPFRHLDTILDDLPVGVLVLAPDGNVRMVNASASETIFGRQTSERLPEAGREFMWHSAEGMPLPRELHPGIRALRGEIIRDQHLFLGRSGGALLPIFAQARPLCAGGCIIGAVVVFQDITGLRAVEQIKDDFLSLISHEFRTPLTAIRGGAHLLARQGDVLDDATRRELLQDILTESGRLDRMLGNLLSVAEIMAGRFRARPEPVLVGPLVQSVIGDYAPRAPGYRFTLDVAPDLPPAEGDPGLLLHVLRNLYENAVKYSPAGSTIHATARTDGAWIAIDVRDEGIGIAPEHVEHVFERFRKPGSDPTVRGMGLGLYLSQLLIEAQDGRIHAASPGVGEGATFTVELPKARFWWEGDDGLVVTSEEERVAQAPDSGG